MFKVLTTILFLILLQACGGAAGGASSSNEGTSNQSGDSNPGDNTVDSQSDKAYALSVLDSRFDQETGELNALVRLYNRQIDEKMAVVNFDHVSLIEDGQVINPAASQVSLNQLSPQLDYTFLLDVSSTVTEAQLSDVKSLIEEYAAQAIRSGSKVSISTFSEKFQVKIRKTQNLIRVKEVLNEITLGGDRLLDEGLMKALKRATSDYVDGKAVQDVVIALTFGADFVEGTDSRAMNVLNKHAEAVLINLGESPIVGIPSSIPVVKQSLSTLLNHQSLTSLVSTYAPSLNTLYELSYISEKKSGNHVLKLKAKNDISCSYAVGTEVKDIYFACVEEHDLPFSMDGVLKSKSPAIIVEGNHFGESTVSLTVTSEFVLNTAVYEVTKRDIFGGSTGLKVTGNQIELNIDLAKGAIANTEIKITDSANNLETRVSISLGTGWPNYHDIAAGETRICVIKEEDITAKLLVNCFDDIEGIAGGQPEGFLVNPTAIAVGRGANCAIDDNGVSCWQHGREHSTSDPISKVPELKNAASIAVVNESACALDDNGVSCWGDYYTGNNTAQVPNFVAPTDLQLYLESDIRPVVCAKDEGVVKCSRWSSVTEYPSQDGDLITGLELACFNSSGVLTCVDDLHISTDARVLESVPKDLNDVSDVYLMKLGGSGHCVINSGKVVCWSSSLGTNEPMQAQVNTPNLINPRRVVSTKSRACALSDQGMVCWGNYMINSYAQAVTTVLYNPIKMNIYNYCAEDDSGIDCWGVNEDFNNDEFRDKVANSHGLEHTKDFACGRVDGGMNCWGRKFNDSHFYDYYLRYGVKKIQHLLVGQNYSCYQMGGIFNCDVASKNNDYSTNTYHNAMENLPTFGNFQSWDGGDHHLCAIDNGLVKCWGSDEFGQVSTFQGRKASQVFAEVDRTCIVTPDKTLECAGKTKSVQ